MKLAGMTVSIAGKAAKNSLKHLSSDEEKRLQARSELMQDKLLVSISVLQ